MTFISSPANAPNRTELVGHCRSCGIQWEIQADTDKRGCPFCGDGGYSSPVSIVSEAPDSVGAVIVR